MKVSVYIYICVCVSGVKRCGGEMAKEIIYDDELGRRRWLAVNYERIIC